MSKPVILGAGSCLLANLHAGIRELSADGDERYEFVMSNTSTGDRRRATDDQLTRCELVIEEASPWKRHRTLSDEESAKLPEGCKFLRVPTIHFNSLWPLLVSDPRNVPQPGHPWGLLPFCVGDRLALRVRDTVADPDQWFTAYFETDINSVVNVKRNHELELADMFARETGCDVQIAAYVANNFRRRRLFETHHHPAPELMAFALIQVLSKPEVQHILGRPFTQAVDEAPAWVERRAFYPFDGDSPIHPAVARYFGLEWYRDDFKYQWRNGGRYTFHEWIAFYLHYQPQPAECALPE